MRKKKINPKLNETTRNGSLKVKASTSLQKTSS